MWNYGLIKKDKELHLRMTNKTIIKLLSVAFSSHLVEDSHQVCTAITVERLMVFRLQVYMIQVITTYKARWPGDLLPETL